MTTWHWQLTLCLEQIRFILAVTSKSHPKRQKYLQGFALLAYMQAADKDKSVQDFLIIDPNPMTDEQKPFTKRFVNEIKQSLSRGRTDA